jgi:probable rRNA maturation factor
MLNCEINIKIDAPFQGSIDESWLRKAVGNVLVAQGMEQPLELGLFITDDDTMRELNRTYRGVDETTDVLAFSLCEESADFVSPPMASFIWVRSSCPILKRKGKPRR